MQKGTLKEELDFINKIKIKQSKPPSLKEWFLIFRKEMETTIDTKENRNYLKLKLQDFKKYYRTIHPIKTKIKKIIIKTTIQTENDNA